MKKEKLLGVFREIKYESDNLNQGLIKLTLKLIYIQLLLHERNIILPLATRGCNAAILIDGNL